MNSFSCLKRNQLYKERKLSTEKFSRIGFGHGMRCAKINISFTKEDKLKNDLEELECQLYELKKQQEAN